MSVLPSHLNRQQRRAALKKLREDNAAMPVTMTELPRSTWPKSLIASRVLLRVWRSRDFLAQLFREPAGVDRLSINRTSTVDGGRWDDNISWDELMRVKAECGLADHWAAELFPAQTDVVNVANMRHLWLLPEAPAFAWRRAAK